MTFLEEMNLLEDYNFSSDYILLKGKNILITAPHTMEQIRKDGSIKYREPYTKALALYLHKYEDVSCLIKIKDTKEDSNRDNHDEFKKVLIDYVKNNNIKLVIDLHGASIERDFDIEFGTLNNLTTDYTTLKELSESFTKNGINNIAYNNPFKGGAITQYLYNEKDVDAIQLEINAKFRDYHNPNNLQLLTKSLIDFIKKYKSKENKKMEEKIIKIEKLTENTIDFDTFSKSDIRVVYIKDCRAVPKSKKLLEFTLDDGTDQERTILSGIRDYYEPLELIGKKVLAIINIPPRNMMGKESKGMLLSAVWEENSEEKLQLVFVDNNIPAGSKLY